MRLPTLALLVCATPVFAATPLDCPAGPSTSKAEPTRGDPKTREAAQRGLEFLVREATAWQKQHECYGCHVHSVTVEALSVGLRNQYDVAPKSLDALLDGMLKLRGGARTKQGLSYEGNSLFQPSRAFGGAAFARYDAFVGTKLRDDLISVATQLLAYQQSDGSVAVSYNNAPVATGDVQGTAQAISTWKQAYAGTADAKWLAPVQRAEAWLQAQARSWKDSKTQEVSLADLNFAVIGLSAAGVGSTEAPLPWLTRAILERQQKDGSFGGALNTGQALYALRLVGFTDADKLVSMGTHFLVSTQQKNGGWSDRGFGKAEAMWAVLGLVSVDVMTVSIAKLGDGEHVLDTQPIDVTAKDNKGDGVRKVELFIDDAKVAEACGASLSHSWSTASLASGKHLVVAVATSFKGLKSQRQLEVFSGNTWLTQVGSEFDGANTRITARDLSPEAKKHSVEVSIRKADVKEGKPVKGEVLFTTSAPPQSGPLKVEWSGKDKAGKAQPRGRYFAELVYRDEQGKELQREETLFNHDTAEAEEQKYGQVYGKLNLAGGPRGAAQAGNAQVELVDEDGKIVQSTWTTEQGNYRFKNLDTGKYKVRVKKQGYDFADMPVSAAPAKQAEASGELLAK